MLVDLVRREGEKGAFVDKLAIGETKLAKRPPVCEQARDRLVGDKLALVQIDFENVRAMLGEGKDRIVG